MTYPDLSGKKIGRLTVVRIVGSTERGRLWLVRCDCGVESTRITADLNMAHRKGEPMCKDCAFKKFKHNREVWRNRVSQIRLSVYRKRATAETLLQDPLLMCNFESNEVFERELMADLEREIGPRRNLPEQVYYMAADSELTISSSEYLGCYKY